MKVSKGKIEDYQRIIDFSNQNERELSEDFLKEALESSTTGREGIYLVEDNAELQMVGLIWPWRDNALKLYSIISEKNMGTEDFTKYLGQIMDLYSQLTVDKKVKNLFYITEKDVLVKAMLNAGFDIYAQLFKYVMRDIQLPEVKELPITVRPFTEEDLEQIIRLEQSIFMPEFWNSRNLFKEMANNPQGNLVVAEIMGQVVGYNYNRILESNIGHLVRIGVHPDYQGLGVASTMMRHAINWFEKEKVFSIILHVLKDNYQGRGLYEKFGFQKEMNSDEYILIYR